MASELLEVQVSVVFDYWAAYVGGEKTKIDRLKRQTWTDIIQFFPTVLKCPKFTEIMTYLSFSHFQPEKEKMSLKFCTELWDIGHSGILVNQDYGNWSFSLLTRDFDLWDDERHSQKALITGEMASFEIYFMAH